MKKILIILLALAAITSLHAQKNHRITKEEMDLYRLNLKSMGAMSGFSRHDGSLAENVVLKTDFRIDPVEIKNRIFMNEKTNYITFVLGYDGKEIKIYAVGLDEEENFIKESIVGGLYEEMMTDSERFVDTFPEFKDQRYLTFINMPQIAEVLFYNEAGISLGYDRERKGLNLSFYNIENGKTGLIINELSSWCPPNCD